MIATLQAFDNDDSQQGVTLEWIQSLSPELKDAALYRFCRTAESKPTLVESFTLTQVIYRTISGGTFTESADNVAERTGCDRKTILKGLSIAKEQNIIEENKRPGTSSEYWFKPVEEWLPEPVVRIKDIRTKKVLEFPKVQATEERGIEQQLTSNDEVVRNKDDHQTDSNNKIVVVNKLIEEQQHVAVSETDTPTIWRSLPDGSRYAQVPPIHDQEVGVEIQRQMDSEGLTAQKVVGRAIALTKVPLMLLELWAAIGSALSNSDLNVPKEVVVSLQLSKTLEMIGVNLSPNQLHKCVTQYGEDVMLNAANELKRTGVLANKENPTGYFLGCLKNGMGQKPATAQKVEPFEQEQMKPDTTSEMGQALKKPVKSFSHAETNPRVAVARLIMDGQYQRAAILAEMYKVDYEELLSECGLADDPDALILCMRVTQ
ncbi:MAG: hypothetical protein PUP92_23070 [Rhizonema sp. PD38]|nr:hypothetical protein [Rhizonema sp. PD38]